MKLWSLMAKSACVKPSHGWMDQTKTGLSPMRLLFMSCVKPKVNIDLFLSYVATRVNSLNIIKLRQVHNVTYNVPIS